MNDYVSLSEFSALSATEKMILRLNAAAEAVEFARGSLVSAGEEPNEALEYLEPISFVESKRDIPKKVAPKVEVLTAADPSKKWLLVDAEGVVLGRLATIVANLLRGKNAPTFTPHLEVGANVIVINADKVQLTGNKRNERLYYWHTGHPGGIKQRTARQVLEGAHPERVVVKAVERMVTRSRLGREQMNHLRVFAGTKLPEEVREMMGRDFDAVEVKGGSGSRSKYGKFSR